MEALSGAMRFVLKEPEGRNELRRYDARTCRGAIHRAFLFI